MRDTLTPGDVLTVTRLDPLARSTFDLFAIVKRIVDAKAQFRSLAEPVGRHRHQHRAAQKKEAKARRAQGATLDELARSYNVGISTIRRAPCAA